VRDEIWTAVAEAMKPYAGADGKLNLNENLVLVAVGSA
jgi:hypothetical protein